MKIHGVSEKVNYFRIVVGGYTGNREYNKVMVLASSAMTSAWSSFLALYDFPELDLLLSNVFCSAGLQILALPFLI